MNITERLDETLRKYEEQFAEDQSLKKTLDLLREMKELDMIQPQGYTLPPVDTIGKRLYEATTCKR